MKVSVEEQAKAGTRLRPGRQGWEAVTDLTKPQAYETLNNQDISVGYFLLSKSAADGKQFLWEGESVTAALAQSTAAGTSSQASYSDSSRIPMQIKMSCKIGSGSDHGYETFLPLHFSIGASPVRGGIIHLASLKLTDYWQYGCY